MKRTREDVEYTLGFLEVSVLLRDRSVWTVYLEWLRDVLGNRGLPGSIVDISLRALLSALPPELTAARRLVEGSLGA